MNVTWLNARLAVSPQIQLADIDNLKAKGFRMIVNNRPDAEAPDQPTSDALEREAIGLGLRYAYIPIIPGEMTDHDVAEFAQAVSDADGPVLAFCRTGNRSTQLWNHAREIIANPTQS
jgi:uncharacterized protein (TIGR01244 family)